VIKSYYNDGQVNLPLYYYRDKDKNEIDLIIEEAGTLYPVEVKATSDPQKAMLRAFDLLKKIPDRKVGSGAVVCLVKDILAMAGGNFAIPFDMI